MCALSSVLHNSHVFDARLSRLPMPTGEHVAPLHSMQLSCGEHMSYLQCSMKLEIPVATAMADHVQAT